MFRASFFSCCCTYELHRVLFRRRGLFREMAQPGFLSIQLSCKCHFAKCPLHSGSSSPGWMLLRRCVNFLIFREKNAVFFSSSRKLQRGGCPNPLWMINWEQLKYVFVCRTTETWCWCCYTSVQQWVTHAFFPQGMLSKTTGKLTLIFDTQTCLRLCRTLTE